MEVQFTVLSFVLKYPAIANLQNVCYYRFYQTNLQKKNENSHPIFNNDLHLGK